MRLGILRSTAVASVLGIAVLASGCAPGGGGTTGQNPSPSTVSTDISGSGPVTLELTDFWAGVEGEWIEAVIDDFEKKHPDVTIERTTEEWGQLNSTLNLKLQSDDGPDIASANNGWQSLGTLARGGLVRNLDPYVEAYGWGETVPPTIARQNQFSTDFTTMGTGSWFGTPMARTALIGLYYNIDELKALGLQPPTTLAELESAAAAVKAAGKTVFAYGSLDGVTAPLLGVQAALADKTALGSYVYGDTSVKVSDIAVAEAAKVVGDWASKGYFPEGYNGIDYNTAIANFKAGQGVFRWEYTGSLGLDAEQQKHFGYTQLAQSSGSVVAVGAAPAAMVISSRSEHPDVAAAFLDAMMSPEAGQRAADLGLVPALAPDATLPATSGTLVEEANAAKTLDKDDGYVPYFDWSSPTMFDTLTQQLQLLYAGKSTPQTLAEAVEQDRSAFLAGQG
ncbi:carbohydrate ABC transporter substrate-binding protein, CUT1 family [Quadrisphaera granulorum]|uniref:Carbohydrate ABC transporter substrate-binding protein (CUT1 family) n=1 Tax=Quadrisphaera granulorum TaxID=317664 RepID=A0A315ZQL9_9ACTN|nr:extracellular solute-binding protein [Quadrisphaera granulorum]PWJ47599.1 carbohydrate ABC transporter substrate-binding protein (CUT1 family) [Quadrisphaera granulorum]SZE98729.1 carbohydrate ABC transporter substrate-binding protein, CUT1 family [Quadrisphaera granulorum]